VIDNPQVTWWKIAIGMTIVGGIVVYDALTHKTVIRSPVTSALPPMREPEEGYEARWLSRRARTIRRCRMDARVTTWPQFITCALVDAFPEASAWKDPSAWDPWMADAAKFVESDLVQTVARSFGVSVPNGWQALLWLRGPREAARCANSSTTIDAAVCIAQHLYPGAWPPPAGAPEWQHEFWFALRRLVAGEGGA